MSNSLFKLVVDGRLLQEDIAQILIALDKEKSPKIREVDIDCDDISSEHMMELVNATHQTTLVNYKLALGSVKENLAQSLVEVANFSKKINKCWLLLGQHHLYYRDTEMAEINSVIQLGYAKQVTIDCQSMTATQVDQFLEKLNQCDMTQDLTMKIANLDPLAAFKLAENLNANQKLRKLSLSINGQVSGFDRTIEQEMTQMFSEFMLTAKADISELSSSATRYTSSVFNQGKALLNAFTSPLTACVRPPSAEELLEHQNSAIVEEKKMLNKYA
jgi:hypothetical protein